MESLKRWEGHIDPFKILNNLYFVGTKPASTHLLDTGNGLILFDCGYDEAFDEVIGNIMQLGFNPSNIKYIFITHGHIDHCGAAKRFSNEFNCKTILGKRDEKYVNGETDLHYGKEFDMDFNFFKPDILVNDGDVITIGNVNITAVSTPGHTEGTTTYFFEINDENKTYRCGILGGVGMNTLSKKFIEKYSLPLSVRDEFFKSMEKIENEKVDIFLGNHIWNNGTEDKINELKNGNKYAFVNKDEWSAFIRKCYKELEDLIKSEG